MNTNNSNFPYKLNKVSCNKPNLKGCNVSLLQDATDLLCKLSFTPPHNTLVWSKIRTGSVHCSNSVMKGLNIFSFLDRRKRRAYNLDKDLLAMNFANPTYQKTSTETINSTASSSSRQWGVFRFNRRRVST